MAKSDQVIGRVAEKRVLDTVLASRDPELVAVYGRRRVGRGSGTEEGAGIVTKCLFAAANIIDSECRGVATNLPQW